MYDLFLQKSVLYICTYIVLNIVRFSKKLMMVDSRLLSPKNLFPKILESKIAPLPSTFIPAIEGLVTPPAKTNSLI